MHLFVSDINGLRELNTVYIRSLSSYPSPYCKMMGFPKYSVSATYS